MTHEVGLNQIWKRQKQIIAGGMGILLAVIFLMDVTHKYISGWQELGTWMWIISWFGFLGFTVYAIFDLLTNKRWASIVSVGIVLGVFIGQLNSLSSWSGETAIEIACGLDLLANPAKGIAHTCMYGYPSRQYLLPAMLTILGGKTQVSMNGGVVIYVAVGLVILVWGVNRFFYRRRGADFLAATIPLLMLQSNHFLNTGLVYEQSVYPAALASMIIGLFLVNCVSNNWLWRILLAWSLMFAIFAYTPLLLILGLGYLGGWWLILHSYRKQRIEWMTIVLWIFLGIECGISLIYRSDIKLSNKQLVNNSTQYLHSQVNEIGKHLIFQSQGKPYLADVGWGVFLVTLMAASLGLWGRKSWIIAGWAWLAILGVNIFQGYVMGAVDYRFHRFTVILPVIFTLFVIKTAQWRQKPVLIMVWLILLISGSAAARSFIRSRPINWQAKAYSVLRGNG